MQTWIVNLDTQPQRWAGMARECRRVGLHPTRWQATPDNHYPGEWAGRTVPDISRRQAINTTYRRLLAYLEQSGYDDWVILQDDVTITLPPQPPVGSLLHLFGGWRLRYLHKRGGVYRPIADTWHLVNTSTASHVCPQAFYLHRALLPDLAVAWSDTTRQVCESWIPLLREHATFEPKPSIEPPHSPTISGTATTERNNE